MSLKQNRTKRTQMKLFFVEGVQNIKDAISNNWEIEAFIYSSNTNLSSWAKSILNKANFNYIVSSDLMNVLSDKDDVSEILAIVRMKNNYIVEYSNNPISYYLIDLLKKVILVLLLEAVML